MQKKNLSYAMMVSAMLLFGSIGVVRSFVPLPSATLAFFRGLIGSAVLLLVAVILHRPVLSKTMRKKLPLLILSGAMIGLNWVFLFEAYRFTTVATATVCYYVAPLIAAVLAVFIFRERLTVKRGICLGGALLGVCLVSGVIPFGANISKGVPLALLAACLYAGVMLINQRLKDLSAYEKTLPQLFFAALAVLPYALIKEGVSLPPLTLGEWALTLAMCVLQTGVAYALYFGACGRLSTLSVGALSYIDPAFAVLLSAVALLEPLTPWAWVGAALTLLSAALFDIPLKRKTQEKEKDDERSL